MDWGRYVKGLPSLSKGPQLGYTDANSQTALAEHYAMSKTPFARGLRVVNTERASVSMRERIYAEGGILSVTSRILVVDLLSSIFTE